MAKIDNIRITPTDGAKFIFSYDIVRHGKFEQKAGLYTVGELRKCIGNRDYLAETRHFVEQWFAKIEKIQAEIADIEGQKDIAMTGKITLDEYKRLDIQQKVCQQALLEMTGGIAV